ncbi:DUF4844 domain-containing protein [Acinetobacter corruptisaponis]|uniref:DUF4844 domain-containing protein n=1 Tax=Acinetobacter corruptisaponis TaxID=3045147 RepID=A0ABY8S033_9GAMM|nr:DUF4844 domain-containing protein [Acinetobacter sp. KCTC 92772]WHP04935.1 DUF4844 domain-containing protein [Acinetobacter sp. KCTC 92772]
MKFIRVLLLTAIPLLSTSYIQATNHPLDKNMLPTTANIIQQLEQFKKQDHFIGDNILYTGVQDQQLKDQLNQQIADTAQQFIKHYENSAPPTKAQLLQTLSAGIHQINPDHLDTEDREQVATTFEQFLDILGLESSEGILNTWMYGEEVNDLIEQNSKPFNTP